MFNNRKTVQLSLLFEHMYGKYSISLISFGPSSIHQVDRLLHRMCVACKSFDALIFLDTIVFLS